MLFVLLFVTVAYFVIIAKLRSEHTKRFREYRRSINAASFVKARAHIFEILNKISLSLLAVLSAYSMTISETAGIVEANCLSFMLLLWIAFSYSSLTTFFFGFLEIYALNETIKNENSE